MYPVDECIGVISSNYTRELPQPYERLLRKHACDFISIKSRSHFSKELTFNTPTFFINFLNKFVLRVRIFVHFSSNFRTVIINLSRLQREDYKN